MKNFRTTLKIAGIALFSILLVAVFVMFAVPSLERLDDAAVEGSADWMAALPDDCPLAEINLPGTHDSGAAWAELPMFTRCQQNGIGRQLEDGFRYLDIRLCYEKGDFTLHHDFAKCVEPGHLFKAYKLDTVLSEIYGFLDTHPTEAVVFCVKREYGDCPLAEFQTHLSAKIGARPDRWLLTDEMPTLGEARGKILLLRRYDDAAKLGIAAGIDLRWNDQGGYADPTRAFATNEANGLSFSVQDRYEYDVAEKWAAFTANAETESLTINFTSTKGHAAVGHPYRFAKDLNRKFFHHPEEIPDGWIVVDFGTATVAEAIYRKNFD